jgi:hypothetical protein
MSDRTRRHARLVAPLLLAAALALTACGTEQPVTTGAPAGDAAPAQDDAAVGANGEAAEDGEAGPAGAGSDAVAADGPVKAAVAGAEEGDACAILSRSQAAEALATTVQRGQAKQSETGPQCVYAHRQGEPMNSITVGISDLASTPAEMKQLLDQVSTGYRLEPLRGLGDEAYYVRGGNIVYVALDGAVYTVNAFALEPRKPAVEGAKHLVDNLT